MDVWRRRSGAGALLLLLGASLFSVRAHLIPARQNNERALKGASHELKGVMTVLQAVRRLGLGLCLPLLAIVDYRGFRLLATRCDLADAIAQPIVDEI